MPSLQLIVFTRYPVPGATKTRLIPALGKVGAARFQRRLTEHMVQHGAEHTSGSASRLQIYYTGSSEEDMQQWLGKSFHYIRQHDGDLGQRLHAAAESALARQQNVLITGIDCPGVDVDVLRQAGQVLEDHDVVIGPALDGGYYLIGLRHGIADTWPELFKGIDWGGEDVLKQTLEKVRSLGMSCSTLNELGDIDYEDDLVHWDDATSQNPVSSAKETISVIIPALNEATNIESVLNRVTMAENIEVVVVDGGSTDDTVRKASEFPGVRVIHSDRGRGRQLYEGVKHVSGEILLFVHADSLLPLGYDTHIRRACHINSLQAGAFSFQIDDDMFGIRLVEKMTNLRSRKRQIPYGDQALFMRRTAYEQVGGVQPLQLLEDYDLVRRLKKHHTIHTLPVPVVTSGRRWRSYGIWATFFMNQFILSAYHLGVSPSRLARWYKRSFAGF